MSGYKFQAKATTEFGVEFRSKLEAQWAYHFQSRELEWQYADHPWYDFTVNGIKIEIKPLAENMLLNAAKRIPEGEIICCLFGMPPTIQFSERNTSKADGQCPKAFSVWCDHGSAYIRNARSGFWHDDVFFSEGFHMSKPEGSFKIRGQYNLEERRYDEAFVIQEPRFIDYPSMNPQTIADLSKLLSLSERQKMAKRIQERAEREVKLILGV